MKAKRLTMDIDVFDLVLAGRGGRDHFEEQFDSMAATGFTAASMQCMWTGAALYRSQSLLLFSNAQGLKLRAGLARLVKERDPLADTTELGRDRGIQVLAYFRLFEEAYAPFDGHEFFRRHPEYWWQTRCGMYAMIGWPMYNYPEVREHMLERVRDLAEHGVDGALFDVSRSHVSWAMAYRFGDDAIGFNQPVVEEFKRRHGVDLARFEDVEDVAAADHGGKQFVYERRWVATEP